MRASEQSWVVVHHNLGTSTPPALITHPCLSRTPWTIAVAEAGVALATTIPDLHLLPTPLHLHHLHRPSTPVPLEQTLALIRAAVIPGKKRNPSHLHLSESTPHSLQTNTCSASRPALSQPCTVEVESPSLKKIYGMIYPPSLT